MIYLAAAAALVLMAVLWKARELVAVVWSHRKMRAGDYTGALRIVRWFALGLPSVSQLHRQGLLLALAGRPAEAEACYRRALTKPPNSISPRERLMACLGYVCLDQGNFDEAERCFHQAIELGDHSGNSQDGLAELRLVRGIEPEEALHLSRQAAQHAKRIAGAIPPAYWAHQAWALALLGREEEAREALAEALKSPRETRAALASLRWRTGRVLLALHRTEEAIEHFRIGGHADPHGKYGRRCLELLDRHRDAIPQTA